MLYGYAPAGDVEVTGNQEFYRGPSKKSQRRQGRVALHSNRRMESIDVTEIEVPTRGTPNDARLSPWEKAKEKPLREEKSLLITTVSPLQAANRRVAMTSAGRRDLGSSR